jgi:hypothetical protein
VDRRVAAHSAGSHGHPAVRKTDEHEIAGGRQRAAVVRIIKPQRSLDVSRGRIDCLEAAIQPLRRLRATTGEALAHFGRAALILHVLLLDGLDVIATFERLRFHPAGETTPNPIVLHCVSHLFRRALLVRRARLIAKVHARLGLRAPEIS